MNLAYMGCVVGAVVCVWVGVLCRAVLAGTRGGAHMRMVKGMCVVCMRTTSCVCPDLECLSPVGGRNQVGLQRICHQDAEAYV